MAIKEYGTTLILNEKQVRDIREAQWEIRYKGFLNKNKNALIGALGAFSTILSLAFMLPTAVTLTAGIFSVIESMPTLLDEIISTCKKGEDYLQDLELQIRQHPEWEVVDVKLPFLEFTDQGCRIVAGRGRIEAVKIKGHWIEA